MLQSVSSSSSLPHFLGCRQWGDPSQRTLSRRWHRYALASILFSFSRPAASPYAADDLGALVMMMVVVMVVVMVIFCFHVRRSTKDRLFLPFPTLQARQSARPSRLTHGQTASASLPLAAPCLARPSTARSSCRGRGTMHTFSLESASVPSQQVPRRLTTPSSSSRQRALLIRCLPSPARCKFSGGSLTQLDSNVTSQAPRLTMIFPARF